MPVFRRNKFIVQVPPPLDNSVFECDDWWDANGAFRLLHDINPLRLALTKTQAGGCLHNKQLLDIGCGGGIFAEAAAREGAVVEGIDNSQKAVDTARRHAKENGLNINYHCKSGLDDFSAQQYDIITCFEVLEHIENPAVTVADIAKRLTPGGLVLFSTINRTLRAWALMIVALEYVLKIIPQRTHHYEHFIKPAELARWCRDNNLTVKDVQGMTYSFFGHYYRLGNDDAVNYFLIAQRPES